jgi:hypothetical protein
MIKQVSVNIVLDRGHFWATMMHDAQQLSLRLAEMCVAQQMMTIRYKKPFSIEI